MKKIDMLQVLISFLLIFGTTSANAQQQVFTKVFYDYNGSVTANAFLKTPDHHYLIGGSKDYSPVIIKMDTTGNIVWSKKFGTNIGSFNAMILTNDSCCIIGGNCNQPGMFVTKITLTGDTLWSKIIDFGGDYGTIVSVQETIDHGTILSGIIEQNSAPLAKIAVAKLDSLGNLGWTKTFIGSENVTFVATIKQTPDSGFILFGTKRYLNPYYVRSEFLVKLSSDGNTVWVKSPSLTPTWASAALDLMIQDDGFLLLMNSIAGMRLMKTDFAGNFIWGRQTSMGFSDMTWCPNPKLHQSADNGYYFTGIYQLMKTDSLGNSSWSKELFLYANDAVASDDGGYMVVGNGPLWVVKNTDISNPQIGIIKMDSLGNSSDCLSSGNLENTDLTTEMFDTSITSAEGEGTISAIYPVITDSPLSIDNGCVDVVGSVEENQSERFEISAFPNPSTGLFQIRLNHPETSNLANIEIYNVLGEKVYESKNPAVFQSPIDLRSQPDGIYYIKCVFETTTFSGRVIIAH